MVTSPDHDSIDGVHERLAAAMERGDTASVALLVRDHMWSVWCEHPEMLGTALMQLTDADYDAHPSLRVAREIAGLQAGVVVDPADRPALADVLATLPAAQQRQLVFHEMLLARYTGRDELAYGLAQDLRSRLRSLRALRAPRPFDEEPQYFNLISVTETLLGDTSRAVADLRESVRLAATDGRDPILRDTYAKLAALLALRGNLPEARAALDAAGALPLSESAPREYQGRAERIASALIASERMDEGADDAIRATHELVTDTADEFWPLAVLAEGRFELAHQRPAHVLELTTTTSANRDIHEGTLTHDIMASLTGSAYLELGDLTAAHQALTTDRPGHHIRIARLRELIARGAHRHIQVETRRTLAEPHVPLVHRAEAMLISAWADWLQRDSVDAGRAVHVAELTTQNQLARALTTVPRDVLTAIHAQLPATDHDRFGELIETLTTHPIGTRPARLTDSETTVLRALADHSGVNDLAQQLFLSPNTVKSHLRAIYRKLGVRSRDEALDEASRLGLLSPRPSQPGA